MGNVLFNVLSFILLHCFIKDVFNFFDLHVMFYIFYRLYGEHCSLICNTKWTIAVLEKCCMFVHI